MYKGAILAPMVRIGTLPTRLLCLEEGADLVYTEEIIDHRLMDCRKFEHKNGLVEFKLTAEDNPVLQTCAKEKEKVILQLGTADPNRAVKAAKLCQDHISGVDVNMGCPKAYSTKGGMGAAMLKTPDLAESILKALVQELDIPVTCKIRCLKTLEETVEFAKRMEKTGIAALAIHGRQKTERSRDPCRSLWIAEVAKSLKIPVLANGGSGEIKSRSDIDEFQEKTGTAGVLVARAAMWNPSVFNKDGPRHVFEVVKRYCKLCLEYDFALEVMKYNVLSMLRDLQDKDPRGLATKPALSSKEIAECWGVVQEDKDGPNPKKKKLDCESVDREESYPYVHNHFKKLKQWPKCILETFYRKNCRESPRPQYTHVRRAKDGMYLATCRMSINENVKTFAGSYQRNKPQAEQSASLQVVLELGLMDFETAGCAKMAKIVSGTWEKIVESWKTTES